MAARLSTVNVSFFSLLCHGRKDFICVVLALFTFSRLSDADGCCGPEFVGVLQTHEVVFPHVFQSNDQCYSERKLVNT